ncbi:hypothetical protein [Nostoc sp. FACHB-888]|uniref:hypothetical protein n=1 Tax=Nostoc sp. FACHB-888 TaxID=2692842 RepID=UPI001686C4BE|nr:hypothetical protein [Nostoc sp. FACHB-888]MBD2244808.1 hypothetical protein [Nostoc sp. FACHB-888]
MLNSTYADLAFSLNPSVVRDIDIGRQYAWIKQIYLLRQVERVAEAGIAGGEKKLN